MIDLIIVNCHHNLTRHIHIKNIAIQVSIISLLLLFPSSFSITFSLELWACYWSCHTFSKFAFSCRLKYIIPRAATNFQTTVDIYHWLCTIGSSSWKCSKQCHRFNRTCVVENIHGFFFVRHLFIYSILFLLYMYIPSLYFVFHVCKKLHEFVTFPQYFCYFLLFFFLARFLRSSTQYYCRFVPKHRSLWFHLFPIFHFHIQTLPIHTAIYTKDT